LKFDHFLQAIVIIVIIFSLGIIISNVQHNTYAESSSYSVNNFKVKGGTGTVAINPSSNLVYVSNFYSDTVSIFDGSTNDLISTIQVGQFPYGIAINSETNMLYVARESSDVLAIVDGATNNLVKNIELSGPYDITVNSKTNMIYITSKKAHSVFCYKWS